MRFTDKVVIVTGGASGIGAAAAELFAREGAHVTVLDVDARTGEHFETHQRMLGHDITFFEGSAADQTSVKSLYDTIERKHGHLDVLFNNAGIALDSYGESTTLADWRTVMDVNLDGAFLNAQHAVQTMRHTGGGAIVNTSSICGHIATTGAFSYNVSKHAIIGMTRSLALEHAQDGIRVNAVCPGFVNTSMGKADLADDPTIPQRHPMGRIAEPKEIARAVLFLASTDASFITGTSLLIDGGYTAQ